MPKTLSVRDLRGFLDDIVNVTVRPKSADAMQATLGEVKADLAQGFSSSKSPEGVAWAPLKHPRPKGHNQDNKPLIDTGKLQSSVLYQGADHIEGVSGQGLVIGTEVEYAGVHQYGSTKKNIPQRKFMGFSEKILDTSTELTADSVINQIDKL